MDGDENVPASLRFAASLSWRFLLVASAVAVLALAAAKLALIVMPAAAALLLSTQLVPPVHWLRKHGWTSMIASLAVLLGGFVLVLAAGALIVPAVLEQRGELIAGLQNGVGKASDWLSSGRLGLPQDVVQRAIDRVGGELATNATTIVGGIFTEASALLDLVVGALLTLFLLFFCLHDGDNIWKWVVHLFAGRDQATVRAIGSRTWKALAAYVRGVAMVGCVEAILVGTALRIIGVPLVLPLAVITFFGALVPIAGLVFAGALAICIALVTKGPLAALITGIVVIALGQLEGPVLRPLLVGRSVPLHPVAILLTVTASALVWGIPGAFLALPLSVLLIVAASELLGGGRPGTPHEHAGDDVEAEEVIAET
jgi:predicted PurR-regulated permease PerM